MGLHSPDSSHLSEPKSMPLLISYKILPQILCKPRSGLCSAGPGLLI